MIGRSTLCTALCISVMLCLWSPTIHAQPGTVLDSLNTVLASKLPDTMRVNTLLYYAKIVNSTSVFYSHKYTLQALEQSQRIRYKKGEAWSLFLLVGFGDYLDPIVQPRQWQDTLTRCARLASEIQDHELLARIECSLVDSARVHEEPDAARQHYEKAAAEIRQCSGQNIKTWEMIARSSLEWTVGRKAQSLSILDSVFANLLARPIEDLNLNVVGELLIARAFELSKQDPTAMPRVLKRLRGSLSYNRTASKLHREGQILDLIASYYGRTQEVKEQMRSIKESMDYYKASGSRLNVLPLYASLTNILTEQKKPDSLLNVLQEYATAADISGDLRLIRNAYVSMGSYYSERSKTATAASYYMRAKDAADQLGYLDLINKIDVLDPLAWMFMNLKQYGKARTMYMEELRNSLRIVHRSLLITSLNSIGNSFYYANQQDSALLFYRYCKDAIDNLKVLDVPGEDIFIHCNLALAYSVKGNVDSALKYLNSMKKVYMAGRPKSDESKVIDGSFNPWYGLIMSNIFYHQKKYDSAAIYAEIGRRASDTNRIELFRKHVTEALWKSYKAKGDYVKALQYFEEFRMVSDSLESGSLSEQMAITESAAMLERRQHEIELLRRDGKLHEAELKEQELIAAKSRLESLARMRENQSLSNANLLNQETIKRLDQEQKTLEALAARQVQENKILVQEKEIKEAEAAQQRVKNLAGYGGAALMALLAIVLFRSNRQKNQQNKVIADEREKSDALLLNVLPTSIAARLKAGERDIADHYDEVSILFADIVGFTPLSARYEPRAMVSLLNNLYTRFDRLTEQCGVERIKTIGDAYMVVAGAPEVCEDHAERIAGYAMKMQEELKKFSDEIHEKIELRIGISCGEAVGAVVGEKKFAYDLWSDAVNMASRMESHGEAGKIHVSEEFALHLQQRLKAKNGSAEKIVMHARDTIDIKGKGKMQTFFIEKLS